MRPLVVSYGGGINSTAMLVGLHERGIKPDAILFADTGGERPETYNYVSEVSDWLVSVGFPAVQTVRHVYASGKYSTLEEECLGSETLPSIAYGFKKCSLKWKVAPQEAWAKKWNPAIECWAGGEKVFKAIGYHAGEEHRSVKSNDEQYEYKYFLREWGWYQQDCVDAVSRVGLNKAHKSACFFCPSTKTKEILELQKQHPDLLERALTIERKARASGQLLSVRGLGRSYSWFEFLDFESRKIELPFATVETVIPCGCYDGGDDDE